MTKEEILEILLTKSINQHYARRYIDFIFSRITIDKGDIPTEEHHILPKAATQFPEYSSLKIYNWNKAHLTGREHFIAHWMLWKSQGKFMAYAFSAMKRQSRKQDYRYFKITSKIYNQLRQDVSHMQSTRIITTETLEKMSIGQRNKQKLICPHCNKSGDSLNMKKYHFENCKVLTGVSKHAAKFTINDIVSTCPHCNKTGKGSNMKRYHFDNCKLLKTCKVE